MLKASCDLSHRLQQLGHTVLCASPFRGGDYARHQGLDFVELPSYKMHYKPWTSRRRIIKSWGHDQLDRLLHVRQIDLVIIDQELHELILYLISSQHRCVLLSQWFPVWPQMHLPPLTSDSRYKPSHDYTAEWTKLYAQNKRNTLKKSIRHLAKNRQSNLRYYADLIGVPSSDYLQGAWPSAMIYRHLPTLHLTISSLDLPGNTRSTDHHIGAQIRYDRQEMRSTGLDLEALKVIAQEKPIIMCTLSSMPGGNQEHLQYVIEAVRRHPEWHMIMTMSGHSTLVIDSLPSHIQTYDWVDQLSLLAHTSVSIHHGGIHTIQECVHHQVPMLVISGGRHDQPGCAARVAHHSIGVTLSADSSSADQIEVHLQELLRTDHPCRRALETHHQAYQRESHIDALRQHIDALLA